jgi:hypothetical protein
MPFRIVDSATRSVCAAATNQQAQLEALIAPWAGAPVTARLYTTGGTLLRTITLPALTVAGSPPSITLGAHTGDTAVSTGTPGMWVFSNGATEIFRMDAGLTGALINHVGAVKTGCTPTLSGVVINPTDGLPGSDVPSWLPAVGVCVEISSGTTVGSAVRAMGGNSYPGTDPDNIVDPWSGGAVVYVSGKPYLVVMGGGHGDSSFNGSVKFGPLYGSGSSTPTWTPFLAGSAVGAVVESPTYTDGRQASTHSYNNLVGVGSTLYSMRTDAYYSGAGNSSPLGFAFTTAGQTAIASYPGGGQFNAAAHYSGNIYVIGGNTSWDRLRIYNIAGNSYTSEAGADLSFDNYVSMAVDSTRGRLLVIGGSDPAGSTTGSAYYNLSTLSRQLNVARPAGYAFALEYDPDRDVFVSPQAGSATVREASASALAAGSGATWTTRTFTGATPPSGAAGRIYGRFRHVPELKGYILVPGLESSVYFFRSA